MDVVCQFWPVAQLVHVRIESFLPVGRGPTRVVAQLHLRTSLLGDEHEMVLSGAVELRAAIEARCSKLERLFAVLSIAVDKHNG